jgi:UrcA family protein
MLKILTALGAAALAASALSTPAAAAPDDTKVVVSYAGLDLSNARDAAQLDRRLHAAAREICGEAATLDLRLSFEFRACQADVLARARTDLRVAMRSGAGRTVALRTN